MENCALDHFKKAREDGLGAFIALSIVSALFDILFELVEQVIDDVSCEDCNTVVVCELLSIWHDLDIKCENSGEFLLDIFALK